MSTATKTIQIGRCAAESFDFIADPQTMPQWAIHNVKAIRRLEGGRWEMDTPRGKATLIPRYERAGGILDHEFVDAGDHVTAVGWTEGTVNATGARFRVPVVHLWRVRDGKIARAAFHIDHPRMLEALA